MQAHLEAALEREDVVEPREQQVEVVETPGGVAAQARVASERGEVGDQHAIPVRADLLVGHAHQEPQGPRVAHERDTRFDLGLVARELGAAGGSGAQRERAGRHVEALRGEQRTPATAPVRRAAAPIVQEAGAVHEVLDALIQRRGRQCGEPRLVGHRPALAAGAGDLAAGTTPEAEGRPGPRGIAFRVGRPGQDAARELALAGVVRQAVLGGPIADAVETLLRSPFVAVLQR